MGKRLLIAIMLVGGFLVLLPLLQEPQELEFSAYATIQDKPKEVPQDDQALFIQALRLSIRDPQRARDILDDISFSDSVFASEARSLSTAIRTADLAEDEAYTYTLIGQSLARIEAWELGVEALEKAVNLNPEYAEAWAYLGEAYQHIGRDGAAALARASAINPLSISVNLFEALYWQRQGDFEQAFGHLQTAHLMDPQNAQLLVEIGRNQVLGGKVIEARAFFERAVESDPHNVNLLKILARYSLKNQLFIEEVGLPAALEAQRLAPRDTEAIYLVADAYWLMRANRSIALSFLDAALQRDPTNTEAHLLKGIINIEVQDFALAREHLEQVLAFSSNQLEVSQATTLLSQIAP